jgi:hypothetical protein
MNAWITLVQWTVWALIATATLVGIISQLLELSALRRPFGEGLSGPARRAWRLSGISLLALTAALTLNFWLQAQRTGHYWPQEPFAAWAVILWLLTLGYRRSRFQLALTRWQLSLLSLTALIASLIEAGLLITTLTR